MNVTARIAAKLSSALEASSYSYTSGATHNFYHYPARFAPDIAKAVIEAFSNKGDVVLDPFMGGGTTIIEGLRLGRRMAGSDLNALAHFVTDVRTTPLSVQDETALRRWASRSASRFGGPEPKLPELPKILNLPRPVEAFTAGAQALSDTMLDHRRQKAFARCALLRLGQLALDCRDFSAPRRRALGDRLPSLVDEMLAGLEDLVEACREAGTAKNEVTGNRLLLHSNAKDIGNHPDVKAFGKAKLIFTSPPYPSVHVLYHRWQYRGRKETAAPYWIARVPDGFYESYYTGGSRTPLGRQRYFKMVEDAFKSVRKAIHPDATVVQLIGFSDIESQLPEYLAAMQRAGFEECGGRREQERLERRVPNRKWYAKLQGPVDASTELLLFHRIAR